MKNERKEGIIVKKVIEKIINEFALEVKESASYGWTKSIDNIADNLKAKYISDPKTTVSDEEILRYLRLRGLRSGTSLGFHSGMMDTVSDRMEEIFLENALIKESLLKLEEKISYQLDEDDSPVPFIPWYEVLNIINEIGETK